jgi:hypothetical protein
MDIYSLSLGQALHLTQKNMSALPKHRFNCKNTIASNKNYMYTLFVQDIEFVVRVSNVSTFVNLSAEGLSAW